MKFISQTKNEINWKKNILTTFVVKQLALKSWIQIFNEWPWKCQNGVVVILWLSVHLLLFILFCYDVVTVTQHVQYYFLNTFCHI